MFESCMCVRQIRSTAGLLNGGMNAVCAVRPSSPPRVSSAAAFSRLPLSNTKSTAGTLSSPLSFLPVDGLLVLLQILTHTHTHAHQSKEGTSHLELPTSFDRLKQSHWWSCSTQHQPSSHTEVNRYCSGKRPINIHRNFG